LDKVHGNESICFHLPEPTTFAKTYDDYLSHSLVVLFNFCSTALERAGAETGGCYSLQMASSSHFSNRVHFRDDTGYHHQHLSFHNFEKQPSVTEQAAQGRLVSMPSPTYSASSEKIKDDAPSEDEIQYPGTTKLFFITSALCLAVFLVALVCIFT
jgi:hypothetical protein